VTGRATRSSASTAARRSAHLSTEPAGRCGLIHLPCGHGAEALIDAFGDVPLYPKPPGAL
jgi:hypothetical protein